MAKTQKWTSLVVALIGAIVVFSLYRFNQHHAVGDEYIVTNAVALFWIPMLLVLLVFRESPNEYGFTGGDAKQGYRLAGILFLLLLPLMIYAAHRPEYQRYYPMNPAAQYSVAAFLSFEMAYGFYLFCWEFFYRGFLLFGIGKSIGMWPSVFVQTIPFGIMHYGKPEFAGSFVSGVILGWVALKSKSFVPCFLLHWAISVTFDVLVIACKQGRLF